MITNKWVLGKSDFQEIYAIRKQVFCLEQNCPEELEFDETDHYALHLVLYLDGNAIGTGRIYHDGRTFRVGRIAVLKEYRGQKLGDLAVRLLLYKVFEKGAEEVAIHAQTYIAHMYKKYGFTEEGEEFMEDGIPHIVMRLKKEDFVLPSDCGR